MSDRKVLAVIVTWNGKDQLLECLVSIKGLNFPKEDYKVLVIDNDSNDGSCESVSKLYPATVIFKNKRNVGYVRAVNQGIDYGLKEGVDYIWILNNDVVVERESLTKLVEIGEQDERIGVICPVIYSYANPDVIDNAGYAIDFWTGRLNKLKYSKDISDDKEKEIEDVDSVLGCSNLVKTSVFRKAGLLRNIYELYFEETDFNVRAKKNNFRVVIAKGATVWHRNAATMNRFILYRSYLLLRNLFIFELLNAKLMNLLVFIPYYFFIHIPLFIVYSTTYGLKVKLKSQKKWILKSRR
jgi:GT2 family glycosyltransferase